MQYHKNYKYATCGAKRVHYCSLTLQRRKYRGVAIYRRPGSKQCWAGIDKKHTRGYGHLPDQERPHGYGYGYDICSGILARVEFSTRAMPAEAHGCMDACQNPYPRVFSVSNTRGGGQAPHGYLLPALSVRSPTGIAYRK